VCLKKVFFKINPGVRFASDGRPSDIMFAESASTKRLTVEPLTA